MLTRCPNCSTRFRVNPEHLYAAAGQVRCGRCKQLFNATHHAITLGPPVLAASYPPTQINLPKTQSTPLIWGIALLLLTLPVQWIWWERSELVATPGVGLLITKLCQQFPCGLQPVRDPKQIEVLNRHLDPTPNHPGAMQFRLLMVNRALMPQVLPLLELRLLDAQSKLIAQRRFTPNQYLPPATTKSQLMWPNDPIQIALDLINLSRDVAGFEIEFR